MQNIEFLMSRFSSGKLRAPAPKGEVLQNMLVAAQRVPDHAQLKPWRFIVIAEPQREKLGNVFVQALRQKGDPTSEDIARAQAQPLRAPLIIAVVASLTENAKVPVIEQQLSAGCAAYAILLAAQAQGFGGMWRTGAMAYDAVVKKGLGLAVNEEITGFLYLGTPEINSKSIAPIDVLQKVTFWQG